MVLSSRSARRLVALVCAMLVGAACSADPPDVSAGALEVVDAEPTPAVEAEPTVSPAPTAIPAPTATTTPIPEPTPVPFALDPSLLVKLPDDWSPFTETDLQDGPTQLPPAGGRLGPVDESGSRWKYTAVLGRLKPREQVAPAITARPEAVSGAAPLTGVPGPARSGRRAVIVKIDNVPAARPQVGLNQADIVYEELVESGVTRFAAVFHSQNPGTVGPVRSGRSTDIGIIDSYSEPLFAFSGANSIFDRLIAKQPILNRSAEVWSGYWRNGGRRAPHNMFTSTESLLDSASGGEAPRPHFAFRDPGEDLHPSAQKAKAVRLTYLAGKSPSVNYEWSRSVGGWQRWQAGTRHVDAAGVQLAPENLVVQFVNYIDTGMTDKWGEDLYEGVSVGSGKALIFTKGHVIEATWTRPSLRAVPTFTDAAGNHVELTPGQTHVALVPPGGASWG